MPLTEKQRATVDDAPLDRWPTRAWRVYTRTHTATTPQSMWLRVVEAASDVGERVRRRELSSALQECASTFWWLCCFVGKWRYEKYSDNFVQLERSLSEMVWNKFPYACPFCARVPCHCSFERERIEQMSDRERRAHRQEVESRLAPFRAADARAVRLDGAMTTVTRPQTLQGFTKMFATVYGAALYGMSVNEVAFHFLEEVGEVAQAVRGIAVLRSRPGPDAVKAEKGVSFYRDALYDEIADCFSWLVAVGHKARSEVGLATHGINAPDGSQVALPAWTEHLARRYVTAGGDVHCGRCGKAQCGAGCLRGELLKKAGLVTPRVVKRGRATAPARKKVPMRKVKQSSS